ncbi:MAG: carboxypeptidase-like regulatory domain-containing protein [Muribaculum sp.]|nr:carboxypeptidase-like regulatory domain-containing protein [Muribaculum sp.]
MNKLKMKGALILLSMGLMAATSSCHSDDPNYDDVVPPVVAEVHNISGSIAAMDGNGISGATVTMSGKANGTATTDANGYFIFTDVEPGDYDLSVSAAGKISKQTKVTVADENAQNVVWNVMLASETAVTEIPVDPESESQDEVKTEALEGNDMAEVPVEVVVPENSVNKAATITVAPIYEESEAVAARASRADENTMLIGAKLSCDDSSVRIENPLDLSFNVDSETATAVTAKKYVNGSWVDVPCTVVDGKVTVAADEFTSYGVFLGITFSSSSRREAVVFSQSLWDNLYGGSDMTVGEATYDYKVGTRIDTKGTTVFTALLIEALARQFGANAYDAKGSYPINVTLPIGTALQLTGTQQIYAVSASSKGKSVTGTQYGTVTVIASTYNRNHTGGNGGNQP